MKRIVTLVLMLIAPILAHAQGSALIASDARHDVDAGPIAKIARINGEPGVLIGAEAAWVIDDEILVGAEASSLVSRIPTSTVQPNGAPYVLRLNEGGIRFGYVHGRDGGVTITPGALIGLGSIHLTERFVWNEGTDFAWDSERMYVLLEPSVRAGLAVTSWMRVDAGIGYRFAIDADHRRITSDDLSGPSGVVGVSLRLL